MANVPVRSQVATTGVHVTPLPVKPVLHAQVKLPDVLVQLALAAQLSEFCVHSSMSLQVTPLPVNPAGHAQVKLPAVLVQVAFAAQLSVF